MQQALDEYPSVIQMLSLARAHVSFPSTADGVGYVIIYDITNSTHTYELRVDDYDKCMNIVRRLGSFPIFPSEPHSDIVDRIRALIRVEFADRGAF